MSDDRSQHNYAAHHADVHTPTPPASPLGGYRRAIPRCALTGEPLSADTVHIPVRAPIDRQSRDHSPITAVPRRISHSSSAQRGASSSSAPLPMLRLDDLLDDDAGDEAGEGQGDDD